MEKNCKIAEALSTVVRVLTSKGVEVFVTGTAGLCILDFAPEGYMPHDIDLKIEKSKMTPTLWGWLREQEELQGIERNKDYKDESYTLVVKGVTVNVIVSDEAVEHIHVISISNNMILNIENPFKMLKEKDMLNRPKDKDFIISLINRLTSLYQ